MTNRRYRILTGVQYPPDENRRREPGEIVQDIPSWLGDVFEADGIVERVRDNPEHEVAEPEAPSAVTETPDGDVVIAHVDEATGKPELPEDEVPLPEQHEVGAELFLEPEGDTPPRELPTEPEPVPEPTTLPEQHIEGAEIVLEPEGEDA